MSDGFADLEATLGHLIAGMAAGERRKLARRIATDVRRSQAARIGAQRNPDGSAFEARKKKEPPPQGQFAARFLYPSAGSGPPRVVFMRSWITQGPLMTGFDAESGAIRSFFFDKVIKWLPVEASEQNAGAGKPRRRGQSVRQQALFRKIRGPRFLLAGGTDSEAWVGFASRVARVARVHQDGLRDRPARNAAEVQYPQRRLLGLSEADRRTMIDTVLAHFTSAA